MSDESIRLVARTRKRVSRSKWHPLLTNVSERLTGKYGLPRLGNYDDPVREIFYIALSAKTTEKLYQRAERQLWEQFPSLELLANARATQIKRAVACAGLASKRSRQLKAIAQQLIADFGDKAAVRLRAMSSDEAFGYLTSLPGIGPKSAFCIMMCSLDMDVFPVDVNVQRVASRLGVVGNSLSHYRAQRDIPRHIPAGHSYALHVGLVAHGRSVCTPRAPKCEECCLSDLCRSASFRPRKRARQQ